MPQAETRFDVAVIGMSGQFPGARDLKQFWQNLADGIESIRTFTDEELLQRGVDPALLHDPAFVKAAPVLDNPDQFAAAFFGYSPREAELMDPQQRLFLEHSWAALEDAGYAPRKLKQEVGVFAGMSLSSYLLFNLVNNPAVDSREESFQAMIGGDKDFLCTRVSYKLNFKGPSLTIQTGCSSSLVAAHLAVLSLITYQCDLAITGGVSVGVPQRTGYLYQQGGIASPDGHCRPFDAEAQGTVFGEGIGVLIFKRYEDALRDRDHVYALIRGSAVNNDGSSKIGFTAPGVEGQIEVISRALASADVPANTIGHIETHGTGTALGDPVEVAALQKVFQQQEWKQKSCALGAIKSNIGHLDAAAGAAGLIKSVLMFKNKHLVPTLHFKQANPKIDFQSGPFYVNTKYQPWTSEHGPLRAGVSSFGIGGTNAHMVLEEAPSRKNGGTAKPLQIVCLSADTSSALEQATDNLCRHLTDDSSSSLADIAYTLHLGREQFKHRRAVVCSNLADAQAALNQRMPDRVFTSQADTISRPVAFMFPGGGSQYAGMGADLYDNEPIFRQEIDRCAELLKGILGYDLRKLICVSKKESVIASQRLLRPSAGLPAIFSTEYALARLLLSWGLKPACMIGHSLGEYAAACLAGVCSLEDALRLVVFRGRLFESLPSGSMLSVNLPESEVGVLPEGVEIAAVNTREQCVISGPARMIDDVAQTLTARNIEYHHLHIEAAAHCSMVEPVMEQFRRFLEQVPLSRPSIPFISNLTGTWITDEHAADVNYWVRHLRHTVRFAEGIQKIADQPGCAMLEVGPGRTLASLARQQLKEKGKLAFSLMRHPNDAASDLHTLYNALARMWSAGVDIDWSRFYGSEARSRVSLPSYPFERQSYWVSPSSGPLRKLSHSQLYVPSWKRTDELRARAEETNELWIVLADEHGVGANIASTLASSGHQVVIVKAGDRFKLQTPGCYEVAPNSEKDFYLLLNEVSASNTSGIRILHLWTLGQDNARGSPREFQHTQEMGLYSLLHLTRAAAKSDHPLAHRIIVVSNGVVQVSGSDCVFAEKSSLLAACTVVPQEYDNISCQFIDVPVQGFSPATTQRISAQILAEATNGEKAVPFVAYRGLQRWMRDYGPIELESRSNPVESRPSGGTYVITGGLGTLGLLVAQHLAEISPCTIVLTTRFNFLDKDRWNDVPVQSDGELSRKIALLKKLEEMGTQVLVAKADVADETEMEQLFSIVEMRYGPIHGVIHMAGITGDKALRLVCDLRENDCQAQFRPKIDGCYVLRNVLRNRSVKFCVLFSSTASFLGGPGMLAYTAASCFLDSFASNCCLEGQRWISINWDGWIAHDSTHFMGEHATSLDRYALPYTKALGLLDTILANTAGGQIVVSSGDISARIHEWHKNQKAFSDSSHEASTVHERPVLGTEFAPPTTELQKKIAAIWSAVLGIEQIGIHDNLFELGGNSLIGLRIVARLKKELDTEIAVTALFEGPTVFTLAQLIKTRNAPATEEPAYLSSRKRGERRRNARRSAASVN
jgi:acyl transferase domain-containing protein/acyl carrier protein